MANEITTAGITTKTRAELIAEATAALQAIYGADINLDSDSPDGQMMNIRVQAELDLEDLIVAVYNSFDPDRAVGVTLDARCAINGVVRQGGTYTVTDVTVVNSASVNLYGLDQSTEEVYTVRDNAGNRWFLQTTESGLAAGTHVLEFRAENSGEVLTVPNTITVPVTIVLGVTSVNNPTTYTTLGVNEESDAALRIRRQRSVSLPSQGYRDGLEALLENTEGVTFAAVYENDTDATDGDGIPSHSIWCVVGGSAAPEDIANAIYVKRGGGEGMKGSETYAVTQRDGSEFLVKWDEVVAEDLYIEFTATRIEGADPIDTAGIKDYLEENLAPGVYETVNINQLATLVQAFDDDVLVTLAGYCLTALGSYTSTLTPSAKNKQFAVDAARITIS